MRPDNRLPAAGASTARTPSSRIRDERAYGLTRFVRGTLRAFGGKSSEGRQDMVVLGLILLIIGLVAGISILTTIGAILLIVGLILNLVPIGGTRRRVF